MKKVDLSIVIPVFDEEESIYILIDTVISLRGLPKRYEIVFVNDGSEDRTEQIIENYAKENNHIKLISFTRNFGQQAAIGAGLRYATGEYVGILDADLQDPPQKLIEMYKLAKEKGIDIVYAIRKTRKESMIKKCAYTLFYKLYALASQSPVEMDSGDFSVLSKRAVKSIDSMPEKVKFIRGLRSWIGFVSYAFPIERPRRIRGKPKYTWSKLFSLAISGITSTSTKPLRIVTLMGILLSLASVGMILVYISVWLTSDIHGETPGFITIVILILFFSGLQLFTLGLLGEYIATIFLEVKNRPPYIVNKEINI